MLGRPQFVELGPSVDSGPKAEVTFGEGCIGRKESDGIGGKVMRLEAESLEKVADKIADWKTESSLKMREENDVLADFGLRTQFVAGSPTRHSLRNSAAGV